MTTYRGGRWYDGTAFVPRAPVEAGPGDGVVDLDGGWVVPPYGEAHTHWLEPDLLDAYVDEHLRAGVLYVRDLTGVPGTREAVAGRIGYAAAHQGFTAPGRHPAPLFARLAGMGLVPPHWAETGGGGEAIHAVASEADVDRVWPAFLATKPDLVKVFAGRAGLDASLASYVVRLAHAAGLTVAAHAETADDVHVAVTAGVDELAHLPFAEPYRIADEDLRPLRVCTTTQWLDETPEGIAPTRDNIRRLRAAGATVTVGTDLFRTTAAVEADRLLALGLLHAPDLLRAWCVDTCAGMRDDGDFLVLGGDPLADWGNAHDIGLRVRRGEVVTPGDATFSPLT